MRRTGKRLAALLLALIMLVSLFPASAFAVDTEQDEQGEVTGPSVVLDDPEGPEDLADPEASVALEEPVNLESPDGQENLAAQESLAEPENPDKPESLDEPENPGDPENPDDSDIPLESLEFVVGGGEELKIILGGEFTAEDALLSIRSLYDYEKEWIQETTEKQLDRKLSNLGGVRLQNSEYQDDVVQSWSRLHRTLPCAGLFS